MHGTCHYRIRCSCCLPDLWDNQPYFSGFYELIRMVKIKKIQVNLDRNIFKNAACALISGMDKENGREVTAIAYGYFLKPVQWS